MHAAHDGVTWLGTHLHLLAANLEGFLDFGLSKFPPCSRASKSENEISLSEQHRQGLLHSTEAVETSHNG